MNVHPIDHARRPGASAVLVGISLVPAFFLITACTVDNSRGDRRTEATLYAPRPLKLISGPNDFYPNDSKRAKETGEVILQFRIGADGIAQEPFVVDEVHSTSAPRLIKAAKQLYQRSRYEIGKGYRHEVTASVLFEVMPCGKLQQASGLDYYYRLCVPPVPLVENLPVF